MALGEKNISISLVASTLGLSTTNLGLLCNSTAVNRWSINKPKLNQSYLTTQDLNTSIVINEIERNGTKRHYLHYIKYEDFAKVSGVSTDWNLNMQLEEHPYFRLGDFRGYDHQAVTPKIKRRWLEIQANSSNGYIKIELEGMENLSKIISDLGGITLRLDYFNTPFTKVNDNLYYAPITLNGGVFADDTVATFQTLYGDLDILTANKIMLRKIVYDNEYNYCLSLDEAAESVNFVDNFDPNYDISITSNIDQSAYNTLRPKFFRTASQEIIYPNFKIENVKMLWTSFDDPNNLQFHYNLDCFIDGGGIGLSNGTIIAVDPQIELYSLNNGSWNLQDLLYLQKRYLKIGAEGGFVNYLGYSSYFDPMGYVVEEQLETKPFVDYIGANNENWSNYAVRLVLYRVPMD